MSTMRLSVKTCTPTGSTYSTPSITTKFLPIEAKILQIKAAKTTSSDIKCSTHKNNTISQSLQENEKSTLLRRREAVGLGFCFTIIDQLLLQQESTAAAAETEFTSTPSGLAYFDKLVGSGSQAVKGLLIKAHYTGKLENGKVFDSSYNRGKPLTFRVGVGEVIKGWDQGILGGDGVPPMQAGGKRSLKIPPQLAYGARGAGCRGGTCVIPPDSVLFFDVEFIGKA